MSSSATCACLYLLRCAPQQRSINRSAFIIPGGNTPLNCLAANPRPLLASSHKAFTDILYSGRDLVRARSEAAPSNVGVTRARCSSTVGIRGRGGLEGGTLISPLICILAVNLRQVSHQNITVEAAMALVAWGQVFLLQIYLVSFAFRYLGTKLI